MRYNNGNGKKKKRKIGSGGRVVRPKNKKQRNYNKALKRHRSNVKRAYGGTTQERIGGGVGGSRTSKKKKNYREL